MFRGRPAEDQAIGVHRWRGGGVAVVAVLGIGPRRKVTPPDGTFYVLPDFRAYSQNFLTAFPGSKFEVLRTIAQGDYVVTHWKASGGTHSGPLRTPSGGTVPPTGKSAVVMGSTTTQLKNGSPMEARHGEVRHGPARATSAWKARRFRHEPRRKSVT